MLPGRHGDVYRQTEESRFIQKSFTSPRERRPRNLPRAQSRPAPLRLRLLRADAAGWKQHQRAVVVVVVAVALFPSSWAGLQVM